MTEAQREDLLLEWEVTPSKIKQIVLDEYKREYGDIFSRDNWEQHLVDILNMKQMWESNGLM
ncbi:hypothetical protein [Desulfopila sp. IMCC35008]|uniref:hypothetical protein n=1 Tax=Desulfopila sp. IMCC35008 TaxID=2653858 RepID=UPI0013D202FD|nr:hypothetical protein [Desulfopila sp. IMCC35008]